MLLYSLPLRTMRYDEIHATESIDGLFNWAVNEKIWLLYYYFSSKFYYIQQYHSTNYVQDENKLINVL